MAQQYEDNGDNGIEADNNGDDNTAAPRSHPTISNVTLIGVPGGASSDVGMLLREGTAGALSNMVVTGFADACLDVDHSETFANVTAGDLTLTNSIVDCATPFDIEAGDDVPVDTFFGDGAGNEEGDPGLVDPFNLTTPGFKPSSTGLAATGGSAPSDAFFDAVSYRGGVDPSDDWTAGWTTSARN